MTNRVHINAPAGIIDIEGEKEFIDSLLSKIFPLIEEAGFGSQPEVKPNEETSNEAAALSETELSETTTKSKVKRRKGSTPPKGQSCADRILTLKTDGFFKTHRTGAEIVTKLAEKGWTHKSNQVAAAAGSLFERGEIQRTKENGGTFKYFWDRN